MIDLIGKLKRVQISADDAAVLAALVLGELHSKQDIYPSLALPITLPANGTAWTYGTLTEIIPINTIAYAYNVKHISISGMSANASYTIRFTYGADDTEWAFASMTRGGVQNSSIVVPIQGITIPANSVFKGEVADSIGTSTLNIKVYHHPSVL